MIVILWHQRCRSGPESGRASFWRGLKSVGGAILLRGPESWGGGADGKVEGQASWMNQKEKKTFVLLNIFCWLHAKRFCLLNILARKSGWGMVEAKNIVLSPSAPKPLNIFFSCSIWRSVSIMCYRNKFNEKTE